MRLEIIIETIRAAIYGSDNLGRSSSANQLGGSESVLQAGGLRLIIMICDDAEEKSEYLKTTFDQIRLYRGQSGVRIIVPIFPLVYNFKQYKWRDINDLIVELCKKNGLAYVSLLEPYSHFDYNEMRVQRGDFGHPSVKGNEVAAEAIAGTVLRFVENHGRLLETSSHGE